MFISLKSHLNGTQAQNALRVGTIYKDGQLRFFLQLTTEFEDRNMESILYTPFAGSELCRDCVWNVVVNWNATRGAVNNLKIHNPVGGGKIQTTVSQKKLSIIITTNAYAISLKDAH